MKIYSKFKSHAVAIISYLTALLFVYASVSKILDFENFQVQLGKSPLLSAFAEYIAFVIPISEIFLAVALSLDKFRYAALKASYLLMIIFTTYIYVILNYSAYVPCSCGGVLEEMTWNQHFIFNIIFIVALIIAIIISPFNVAIKRVYLFKNTIISRLFEILITTVFGIVMIILVFKLSEKVVQYSNTLIRHIPPHAAQLENQFDLKVNSYYFAGSFEGRIYLGNSTAPLLLTEIDTALSIVKTHKIIPDNKELPFQAPMIKVFKNHFFLFEGNVPYIFRGKTDNWKAILLINNGSYFSHLEPINENKVAVRFIAQRTGKSILGTIDLATKLEIKAQNLLETQFDGIFDVDGSLHTDAITKEIIYIYRYRNQFILADENANLKYRGNTIDTISKAQIEITEVKSKKINTFSAPPLIVNKMSAVNSGLLFVNSNIPGKYEDVVFWKDASLIDIYDLSDNSYQASFPIYNVGTHKMQSFLVLGDKVYVLIENQIVSYRLLNHLFAKSKL